MINATVLSKHIIMWNPKNIQARFQRPKKTDIKQTIREDDNAHETATTDSMLRTKVKATGALLTCIFLFKKVFLQLNSEWLRKNFKTNVAQ